MRIGNAFTRIPFACEPKMKQSSCFLTVLFFYLPLLFGCDGGGEKSFSKVALDPAVVAEAIMAEYDADGDGEVSRSELKKCKGLQMLAAGQEELQPQYRLDQDGNGSISQKEFTDKLTACFADKRQSFSCAVKYRGKPLKGAIVTLVPESFMGDVQSASGETDKDGNCSVTGDDGLLGTVPGIYRVEITHPDHDIKAKYNTETTESVALDTTNPYAQVGTITYNVK